MKLGTTLRLGFSTYTVTRIRADGSLVLRPTNAVRLGAKRWVVIEGQRLYGVITSLKPLRVQVTTAGVWQGLTVGKEKVRGM